MLSIDGSMGEGGGQILRTALALSLVLGRPCKIINLRARRRRPGLRRQHLVCVRAAAEIGNARLEGADLGSQELSFVPSDIRAGDYSFDIGTAGSTTLVLQTLLPVLLTAKAPSTLTLKGGTHNPLAPPFEFLDKVFLPLINQMGPAVEARLERPGYYPQGGGEIQVEIRPSPALQPLHVLERGPLCACRATATIAGLPRHIAERELDVVQRILQWPDESLSIREEPAEMGPGNVLTLEMESQHITELWTGFGRRGIRAETVAAGAAKAARRYLQAGVPVGEHLADQLILPLALAGQGSFSTLPPTSHTTTNWQVVQKFLSVRITSEPVGPDSWCIVIEA